MKRAVILIVLLMAAMAFSALAAGTTAIFIHGAGCPHCAKMDEFLVDMEEKYPALELKSLEVYFNERNKQISEELKEAFNNSFNGVPIFYIGDLVVVGFDESFEPKIEAMISDCVRLGCENPADRLSPGSREVVMNSSHEGRTGGGKGIGVYVFVFFVIAILASVSTLIYISRKKK